jgi:preprotein translocase subunit SecE
MGLVNYIRETRGELKHVSWPTRSQAIAFTAIVIILSLGLAFFLGLFDYAFSEGVKYIINNY